MNSSSTINRAIAIAVVLALPLCLAFSRHVILHAPRGHHVVVGKFLQRPAHATVAVAGDPYVSTNNCLGPPTVLSSLQVGEKYHHPLENKNITRLSAQPDIFLIRNLIASSNDRDMLMDAAIQQGMKVAGTKESKLNTIRKHSYLTWIDPYSFNSNGGDNGATSIARETIGKACRYFAHEVMNNLMENVERLDHTFPEDMQIAKYDTNGSFDYHHDGYGRYLTVITYLNGIGGTYFPFGNMGCKLKGDNGIDFTNEHQVSVMAFKKTVDKCGLLIAGKEGANTYNSSSSLNPKTIVDIQAGDAIAFYNYDSNGDKDQRSLHCSLTVPEEKWISTCWFRSEALTGPFRSMKIVVGAANSIV